MDRRLFLKKAALIAAGVVAADQADLLDRLLHKRRFWPGADFGPVYLHKYYEAGFTISKELLEDWKVDFSDTTNCLIDPTRLWVHLQNPHIISS